MPGWITKVQYEIKNFSNTPNIFQLGKVREENVDILFTSGISQMASWVGRAVGVAWDISTLENARSYFEIDDSSSFAKQQVQIFFIFSFILGIIRKNMPILSALSTVEEKQFLLIGFPQSVQRNCLAGHHVYIHSRYC